MRKIAVSVVLALSILFAAVLCSSVGYAAPAYINSQGKLTDPSGIPVADGAYSMTFQMWNAKTGGALLWAESQSVSVKGGMYNVVLGKVKPLTPILFSTDSLWLAVYVKGQRLTPNQQITSVAFAMNAATLNGVDSTGFATAAGLTAKADKIHQHSGTDITTGTVAELRIDPLIARSRDVTTGLATKANTAHTHGSADITGTLADGQIPGTVTRNTQLSGYYPKADVDAKVAALQTQITTQANQIASLQTSMNNLTALLQNVTRSGDDITFSHMNVHIVSGSGATNGTVNGLGNLIVGYNELRASGNNRTGSHNVVVGRANNYSSYGGLVAGYSSGISGQHSTVTGGYFNNANGDFSSVSGGTYNSADGYYSSVSGGSTNTATGYSSSISGGYGSSASGAQASVSGGTYNTASGSSSAVSGGGHNLASGSGASVTGGGGGASSQGNEAFGDYSSVAGGMQNVTGDKLSGDHTKGFNSTVGGGLANAASGIWSSVAGGSSNRAMGNESSVSGGTSSTASGEKSSVSAGDSNTAHGRASSVSGGEYNSADGDASSVSGGFQNGASGTFSSVSGGSNNAAGGERSSVGGGKNNRASGSFASVAGGGSSDAALGNEAYGDYSAILGGTQNVAGDKASGDHTMGPSATVSGGHANKATADKSSVSGGQWNTASGFTSSVSGGFNRSAADTENWAAGGLFQNN